jgi:hypothetical protein
LSQNIIQSLTLKCFSACRPDPLSPARRHKLIVFGIKFFSVNLSVSWVLAQRYVEAVGSRCGHRMCNIRVRILVMCVILMVVRLPYVLAVVHLNEVTLREVIVLVVIIIVLLILLLI